MQENQYIRLYSLNIFREKIYWMLNSHIIIWMHWDQIRENVSLFGPQVFKKELSVSKEVKVCSS